MTHTRTTLKRQSYCVYRQSSCYIVSNHKSQAVSMASAMPACCFRAHFAVCSSKSNTCGLVSSALHSPCSCGQSIVRVILFLYLQNEFYSGKLRPAATVTRVGRKSTNGTVSPKQPEPSDAQPPMASDTALSDQLSMPESLVCEATWLLRPNHVYLFLG